MFFMVIWGHDDSIRKKLFSSINHSSYKLFKNSVIWLPLKWKWFNIEKQSWKIKSSGYGLVSDYKREGGFTLPMKGWLYRYSKLWKNFELRTEPLNAKQWCSRELNWYLVFYHQKINSFHSYLMYSMCLPWIGGCTHFQ